MQRQRDVTKGRPKGSVRPTAREAAARELRARGYKLQAIAEELGTNRRWVEWACSSARRRKLGLSTADDIETAQLWVRALERDVAKLYCERAEIEKVIRAKREELASLPFQARATRGYN